MMGIEFQGFDELEKKLAEAEKKLPGARDKFLMQEGELLRGKAAELSPVDTGGTLTIIHVLTANGTRKADGGLSYKADGSYKVGGIQLKGGNQIGITSRHDEIL